MRRRKRRDFLLIEKKAKLVPGRKYRYTEWDEMSNWVDCIYDYSKDDAHILIYDDDSRSRFMTSYPWKLTPLEI